MGVDYLYAQTGRRLERYQPADPETPEKEDDPGDQEEGADEGFIEADVDPTVPDMEDVLGASTALSSPPQQVESYFELKY